MNKKIISAEEVKALKKEYEDMLIERINHQITNTILEGKDFPINLQFNSLNEMQTANKLLSGTAFLVTKIKSAFFDLVVDWAPIKEDASE